MKSKPLKLSEFSKLIIGFKYPQSSIRPDNRQDEIYFVEHDMDLIHWKVGSNNISTYTTTLSYTYKQYRIISDFDGVPERYGFSISDYMVQLYEYIKLKNRSDKLSII